MVAVPTNSLQAVPLVWAVETGEVVLGGVASGWPAAHFISSLGGVSQIHGLPGCSCALGQEGIK